MSWLYSRALVEEFSAATCSAGAPSAPSNSTPTPQAYWSHGKTTAHSRLSRYGMTLERLTDDRGAELLTWYLEASRARTSARPARAQASTASDQDSGARWHELSARFDRDTCSWRTHRRLWDEELIGSSVTFPRWGMTVNGVLLVRGTPALPTYASARGSSRAIPTPNGETFFHTPQTTGLDGGSNSRKALRSRQMLPTPRANDAEKRGNIDPTNPRNGLAGWVKWQTPTADDALNREKGKWNSRGEPKPSAQVMLPTPTVQDAKNNGAPSQHERNSAPLNVVAGGKLNPRWVEWLMGWPIGWTSYAPLGMGRFQQWRDSHGSC